MKAVRFLVLMMLVAAPAVLAQSRTPANARDWVPLFNGKDLYIRELN